MPAPDKGFHQRIQRIEALTSKIEGTADPDLRASARELLESVMELHGAGLERMLEIVARAPAKDSNIAQALAEDELISSLLLLYNLNPDNFETRVKRAVDRLQTSATAHGNEIELLSINQGVVRLRMKAGPGCGSGAANLPGEAEQAIYEAAPDAVDLLIEVEEEPAKTQFVPLESLVANSKNGRPQV